MILPVLLTYFGYTEWKRTVTAGPTCNAALPVPEWSQHFRYLEFVLESQHLREPEFEGHYFINLGKEFGKNSYHLKFTLNSIGNYGNSVNTADFFWDDAAQTLWMHEAKEIALVSLSNSHYSFPFDSAKFKYTITFDPVIDIRAVRLTNHVPGFSLPCDAVVGKPDSGGKFEIEFHLYRNTLIKGTAILLFTISFLSAIFIAFVVESRSLPQAVASYFFSIWSIRALFGLTAEGFPTLFDLGLVFLAMVLPVLLMLRFLGFGEFVGRTVTTIGYLVGSRIPSPSPNDET